MNTLKQPKTASNIISRRDFTPVAAIFKLGNASIYKHVSISNLVAAVFRFVDQQTTAKHCKNRLQYRGGFKPSLAR